MTTTAPAAGTAPETTFAQRLRAETMRPHRAAENEGFIVALMAGELDAAAYRALLEQYAILYPALEAALRARAGDPLLAAFDHPGLARTGALNADLDLLAGSDRPAPQALPATRQLTERIGSGLPAERLLAHHYLRYLGDLSGGQIIRTLVARHYGIVPEALTMWRFEGIGKPKVYKDRYRALLDDAALSPAQQDALIDEAGLGYRLNRDIFRELGQAREAAAA